MQVQWEVEPATVPAGRPFEVWITVRLALPAGPTRAPNRPLNLAVAIDRSESMATTLAHAVACAETMIERLRDRDRLALILFADEADLVARGDGADKASLRRGLQGIRVGRATNLSAAWLRCAAIVDAQRTAEALNRIILVTDGQPTRGVTDSDALLQYAAELAEKAITTSVIWYAGEDVDPGDSDGLIAGIARMGWGKVVCVRGAYADAALPLAQLAGIPLPPVVVQNARLSLHPSPMVREACLQGGIATQLRENQREVFLGDLFGERELSLSWHLAGDALSNTGQTILATLSITYDGVIGRFEHREETYDVAVTATSDGTD
jgi:Ca-activated chloride channel homolog